MNTNMTQKGLWRAFIYSSICLTAILLVIFTPNITNAQITTNHAPIITSNPTLSVTTDQTYQYTITATDSDNDSLIYSLTNFPNGLAIKDNIITWQPTMIGTYNVIIEVNDQNNGYDSQSWKITVKAGVATKITVTPNHKPTIVNLGNNLQFTAIAYDTAGNIITNPQIKWTSDGEFTSVDENGLITGKKAGIGFVSASIGNIESAPGIIVLDNRVTPITNTTTDKIIKEEEKSITDKTTTEAITKNDEETLSNEKINATDEAEIMTLDNNIDENDNSEIDEPCNNIAHGLTFTLLIIYALILAIYFIYEKKHKSSSWWIFPLLVTFIGLIVYYRYFCAQTYLWWPWILIVIGILITGYYKGRSHIPTEDNHENELPF